MQLVQSGYIGGTEAPFSLLDTGDTYANFPEGEDAITAMATGPLLDSSSGSTSDNHLYSPAPSLWKGIIPSVTDTATIAMGGDLGLGIAVNDFNGPNASISAGNYFPTNSYDRILSPDMGALYIAAKPNSDDVTLNYWKYVHESGDRFKVVWNSGKNKGWFFFSKFGACYFFLEKPGKLGYLPPGSHTYTNVGELEALKLYAIQARTATATGTVYDPAGTPAVDCRVVAFHRDTDRLVGRATTIHDGSYTMHLNAYTGDTIYMVCLDNADLPDFEAQITDRIIV